MSATVELHALTSPQLAARLAAGPVIALVPVGSTEPHGPHLGLGTDVAISRAACVRAVEVLAAAGRAAVIAPAVPYGVTECAAGFAGAVSVPGPVLTAFVGAVCDGLVAQGFAQVALVNNHLEPAHDAAIRAVTAGRPQVVIACPLTRRWARTLSAEFKSGACHAGRYETSIVLAAEPALVDEAARAPLRRCRSACRSSSASRRHDVRRDGHARRLRRRSGRGHRRRGRRADRAPRRDDRRRADAGVAFGSAQEARAVAGGGRVVALSAGRSGALAASGSSRGVGGAPPVATARGRTGGGGAGGGGGSRRPASSSARRCRRRVTTTP
jgi:creatinine amidohydrolase